MPIRKLVRQRFLEKVDKSCISDCWEWIAGKCGAGYGAFWLNGRQVGAHRVSWELYKGPIPDSLYVLHKCDNPGCVNPAHLFLGTHSDNIQDAIKKGRLKSMENLPKDTIGEKNGRAMITREQAAIIKKIWKERENSLTKTELAKRLGISRPIVRNILLGKTWRHI